MLSISTGEIGRIGRHRAEQSDVVAMCFGHMPSDTSDFPGGIPAYVCKVWESAVQWVACESIPCSHSRVGVSADVHSPVSLYHVHTAGWVSQLMFTALWVYHVHTAGWVSQLMFTALWVYHVHTAGWVSQLMFTALWVYHVHTAGWVSQLMFTALWVYTMSTQQGGCLSWCSQPCESIPYSHSRVGVSADVHSPVNLYHVHTAGWVSQLMFTALWVYTMFTQQGVCLSWCSQRYGGWLALMSPSSRIVFTQLKGNSLCAMWCQTTRLDAGVLFLWCHAGIYITPSSWQDVVFRRVTRLHLYYSLETYRDIVEL